MFHTVRGSQSGAWSSTVKVTLRMPPKRSGSFGSDRLCWATVINGHCQYVSQCLCDSGYSAWREGLGDSYDLEQIFDEQMVAVEADQKRARNPGD